MPQYDHQTKVIMAETKKRGLNDAFVHSVSSLVVGVLDNEHRETMGTGLSKHERSLAKIAATMALTLIEKDEDGNSVIEKTIRETSAEHLRKINLAKDLT